MRLASRISLVSLAVLASSAVFAQDRFIGPEFGIFIPSDSDLRAALGDSWISFGLSTMSNGEQSSLLGSNWHFISQERNGNKVFMASYTLGTLISLGGNNRYRNNGSGQPYFAVRGGLSYIDYAIGVGAGRQSAKAIGYNANAEVGFKFSDQLTLSARYDVFSKHDGFSFDGLSINLRYAMIRF